MACFSGYPANFVPIVSLPLLETYLCNTLMKTLTLIEPKVKEYFNKSIDVTVSVVTLHLHLLL